MTVSGLLLLGLAFLLLGAIAAAAPQGDAASMTGWTLTDERVVELARMGLAGITREYPNKPGHVLTGPEDVKSPRALHPAFYGCFDWHSAVHGHWMLVRLLKRHSRLQAHETGAGVIAALEGNLTAARLEAEAAYFAREENRHFERTYGWAWLLRLAQELRTWSHGLGRRWAKHLAPLETRIAESMTAHLSEAVLPLRSGEHLDGAFGLAFALDYARAVGDAALETVAVDRARHHYARDRDYPVDYEPSAHDFFSAGLNEADLMRRVLDRAAFGAWLEGFLPGLGRRDLAGLARPVAVPDVTDGRQVHLAGLNLTRAWTLRGIASSLERSDARRIYAQRLVRDHAAAGLAYVFSGHYAGEHWLASFAVYLLTDAGIRT